MSLVTRTRTVVIAGRRPRSSVAGVLRDLVSGDEAVLLVLGMDPTAEQRALVDESLAIAADRRIELTAELISTPSALASRLRDGDRIRVLARRVEARRWRIESPPGLSGSAAR